MGLSKLLEKYRQRRSISKIHSTIADYEAWKDERKYLIADARECLGFIDQLPQDKDTKFCGKWLIEIIEALS